MCECVVDYTGNIGDNTTWKDAWLGIASKHRVSEFEEFEEVQSN